MFKRALLVGTFLLEALIGCSPTAATVRAVPVRTGELVLSDQHDGSYILRWPHFSGSNVTYSIYASARESANANAVEREKLAANVIAPVLSLPHAKFSPPQCYRVVAMAGGKVVSAGREKICAEHKIFEGIERVTRLENGAFELLWANPDPQAKLAFTVSEIRLDSAAPLLLAEVSAAKHTTKAYRPHETPCFRVNVTYDKKTFDRNEHSVCAQEHVFSGIESVVRQEDLSYVLNWSALPGEKPDFDIFEVVYQEDGTRKYERVGSSKATSFSTRIYGFGENHCFVVRHLLKDAPEDVNVTLKCTNDPLRVPKFSAQSASFQDSDINRGYLEGSLIFTRAADESTITHYVVYFLGTSKEKLATAQTPIAVLEKSSTSLSVNFANGTLLPEGAEHFGIFTKNHDGESLVFASTPIADKGRPRMSPMGLLFEDTNLTANIISGSISALPGTFDEEIESYLIYFGGNDGIKIGNVPLLTIEKGTALNRSGSLLNVSLPVAAKKFLVFGKNKDGEGLLPTQVTIVDKRPHTVTYKGDGLLTTLETVPYGQNAQRSSVEPLHGCLRSKPFTPPNSVTEDIIVTLESEVIPGLKTTLQGDKLSLDVSACDTNFDRCTPNAFEVLNEDVFEAPQCLEGIVTAAFKPGKSPMDLVSGAQLVGFGMGIYGQVVPNDVIECGAGTNRLTFEGCLTASDKTSGKIVFIKGDLTSGKGFDLSRVDDAVPANINLIGRVPAPTLTASLAATAHCSVSAGGRCAIYADEISVLADHAGHTISNLKIMGNDVGISLINSRGVRLLGLELASNARGVHAVGGQENEISGLLSANGSGIGLDLQSTSQNTLTDVTVHNHPTGINLQNSHKNVIRSASVASTSVAGIALSASNDNYLAEIQASSGNRGIFLSSSNRNALLGATVNSNLSDGVRLESSNQNTILNVTANNNARSIYVNSFSQSNAIDAFHAFGNTEQCYVEAPDFSFGQLFNGVDTTALPTLSGNCADIFPSPTADSVLNAFAAESGSAPPTDYSSSLLAFQHILFSKVPGKFAMGLDWLDSTLRGPLTAGDKLVSRSWTLNSGSHLLNAGNSYCELTQAISFSAAQRKICGAAGNAQCAYLTQGAVGGQDTSFLHQVNISSKCLNQGFSFKTSPHVGAAQ